MAIQEINNLGTVKYIVAPNLFHYLYLEQCKNIYPEASLITPPGLEEKINIQSDYIFTQDYINFNDELEYFLFKDFRVPMGTKIVSANEIVFYHPESKTLIITDIAFHFDSNFPFITRFATRILGGYQQLRPSILEKIVIKERETIINSINKLLKWDFQRIIMAHGTIIEENATEQLKAGYEWFLDTNLATTEKQK